MGGDYTPLNPILATIDAINENAQIDAKLIGDKEKIESVLKEKNLTFDSENIIHTSEVIDMHDSPTEALKKKKDSSLVKGAQLVKEVASKTADDAGDGTTTATVLTQALFATFLIPFAAAASRRPAAAGTRWPGSSRRRSRAGTRCVPAP